MKSRKRSEYKLEPKTGEILKNEGGDNKKTNKSSSEIMFPKNKLIEDHEFDYVIGEKEKFPHENFVSIKSFQYGHEIKLHTYKYNVADPSKIRGIVYLM